MGYCKKHNRLNIDVWYDCEECGKESDEYCKTNNYTQSISPYLAPREGTDNGEWVTLNTGRWILDDDDMVDYYIESHFTDTQIGNPALKITGNIDRFERFVREKVYYKSINNEYKEDENKIMEEEDEKYFINMFNTMMEDYKKKWILFKTKKEGRLYEEEEQ